MRECPRCERCYADDVSVCPEEGSNTRQTLPGGLLLAGRYLLEKRLGRGAMGQVYLARDQNLQTRRVAVKTVRPDILTGEEMQEGEAIARFEREARTAASIRHPNVVDVTDFGKSAEGIFYLVMEYVQGETLHHLLRREGTLNVSRALALLKQIGAGVDAAHDEGILHRDLKPANIFIMQKRKKDGSLGGGDGFVKVGDFGLAKIVNQAISEADLAAGPQSRGLIGTPEYMAPEQMQSGVKLDARADVYALGTVAYHMLGGRPPFTGDLTQLIAQKLMNVPPPLRTLRSDIGAGVERAVMHALEKDPAARSATVGGWLDELEKAVSDRPEPEVRGDSRVVILAPAGAEVYVDDERCGSVGRSGRVVLTDIAPGRHLLRVSRTGAIDDERVIEIRGGASEQIIQAQPRSPYSVDQSQPSRAGSGATSQPGSLPGLVACDQCGSRFAAGARFCGRCGGRSFHVVETETPNPPSSGAPSGSASLSSTPAQASGIRCSRCAHLYPPGTKFCGRCGIPIQTPSMSPAAVLAGPARPVVPPPAICATCSTSYPTGTRFCGRCGTPIVA